MQKKLTLVLVLIASPFLLSKLIDVHVPSSHEMQMEHSKDKDLQNREAQDILNDKDASQEDRERAFNTLLDNGVMA